MIDKDKPRTPTYIMTVEKRADPKLRNFEERLHHFNIKLRELKKKYDLSSVEQRGIRWPLGFTSPSYLQCAPRLGKQNPKAHMYLMKVAGAYGHRNIKAEHAQRFDIYVKPEAFLCGYDYNDEPDISPKFDNLKMLHCENGPALRLNGFTFYYWHGIQVERDTIMRDYFFEEVMQIENTETRRIVMERIGWPKLLDRLNPITINADDDPQIGTLIEILNPLVSNRLEWDTWESKVKSNWSHWRFLQVKCGTGRTFAIRVPLNIPTALEAQAWIWNIPSEIFQKPEVRT